MTSTNMMGAGRYKLIRLLDQAEGFAAYSALDIESSQREQVILNVYAGREAIRSMVPRYYGMDAGVCRDFCRTFTEDGAFSAVFALHEGQYAEHALPRRGGPDAQLREDYAESLLHAALENAGMPPELLAAMLRMGNIEVQEKNRRLCINACIPPIGQEAEAPTQALSALLERVLGRKWSVCDEQIAFLDNAREGKYDSVSALYSAWRELLPVMRQDREKTGLLQKLLRYAKRCLLAFGRARRRRRRQRALAERD